MEKRRASRMAVAAAAVVLAAAGSNTAHAEDAFFYQIVGAGQNWVATGRSSDGVVVHSYGVQAAFWLQSPADVYPYGDPVFSRLPDGTWTMTARSGRDDPRGAMALLYYEGTCPQVDDRAVVALTPSTAPGCQAARSLNGGKTSQIFAATGGSYVFLMSSGDIYLVRLSDPTHRATELNSVCLKTTLPSTLDALAYGEAVRVVDHATAGLLLSDTGIARRRDGTWVLFVKGIAQGTCSEQGGLCELCNRAVYRTTSADLLTWSPLEAVVRQASIPEATTTADGTVWLYYQDFSDTCAAGDVRVAARAPISGVREEASGAVSSPTRVRFVDEAFEVDASVHYATNGNPITLPDAAAQRALEACLAR